MTLETALALVREGRLADAEAARPAFVGLALARLELAIAQARGDRQRALECAARLWHACEVDATVLAVLVRNEHPELRDAAADLLMRAASDAAYDVSAAWAKLAAEPGDLDAWRDVLSSMIAGGRELEAVDGVARALGERHAGFELWALLTTILISYRRRSGLRAAVELGHQAFPHAPEARATSAMIFLGIGELEPAAAELAEIGNRAGDHPLVRAARSAMSEALARS